MFKLFERPKRPSEIINGAIATICEKDNIQLTDENPTEFDLDVLAERISSMVCEDGHCTPIIKENVSNDRARILKRFNIKIVD